jgi:hypothetical protein
MASDVILPLPPGGTVSDDGREWTGPKPDDWVIIDNGRQAEVGELVTLDVQTASDLWTLARCRVTLHAS